MEQRRGDDQHRHVDEAGEPIAIVTSMRLKRSSSRRSASSRGLIAVLGQRRVQVDDVRHHGRAEDAGGQQDRVAAVEVRDEALGGLAGVEADPQRVVEEAEQDHAEEADDRQLEAPVAAALQAEDREGDDGGDQARRRTAERRTAGSARSPRRRTRPGRWPSRSARPGPTGPRSPGAGSARGRARGGSCRWRCRSSPRGSGSAWPSGWPRGAPTAAGSRTWRRRRCWWRSCPGRRRRCRRRRPGRGARARAATAQAPPRAAARSTARWRGSGTTASAAPPAGVTSPSSPASPRARRPPSGWTSSLAKAREDRSAEGLLVDDLERVAGRDPARTEVAQHLGVAVGDADEPAAVADARARPWPRVAGSTIAGRRSGSGRRAGRSSDGRAWRRSAPRAPRRGGAREPRPRRGRDPTARRAPRPGSAPAAGGGAAPPARRSCRARSARRRGKGRARRSRGRRAS